jgi:hypothetical protein
MPHPYAQRRSTAVPLRSELPLQINQIAAEQPVHPLNPVRQIRMDRSGQKVGLARDGELRFEFE